MATRESQRPADGLAIVTGGASGLGSAIAARLTADVRRLVLIDVASDVASTSSKLGPAARHLVLDVTDADAWEMASAEIESWGEPVSTLVACAGILGPSSEVTATSPEQWRRTIEVNLTGVFLTCRAIVPLITGGGGGSVVMIASIAGKEGNAGQAAYSAAKAGVIALTKSLAKELASQHVSVNCIAPTVIEGPFSHAMPLDARAAILRKIPMGRFGQAEEVAAMVAWIDSPECSFTTGFCFDLSGGRASY